MQSHLSSEQLDGVLCGEASQDAAQHLSGCVLCAEEVAALREGFGNMREATTAAAEHHRRFVPVASGRRMPRMAWALAAALFVSIASLASHYRNVSVAGNIPQSPAQTSEPAISDEALLNSVQEDLSSSVPASLLPLAGTSTSSTNSEQRKN